jgi:glycosyltransferase 2 family protein
MDLLQSTWLRGLRSSNRNLPARKETARVGNHLAFTAIKCLVSGLLICWIVQTSNLGDIFAAVRMADKVLLIQAFSLNFVGLYISVYRWQVLLKAVGVNAVFSLLLKSYLVGIFFNNVLPSTIGGDAVRAYDSWRVGSDKAAAVAVIIVDRLVGLLALMAFALGALLVSKRQTVDLAFLSLSMLTGVAAMGLFTWIIFVACQRISTLVPKLRFTFLRRLQRFLDAMVDIFLSFHGRKAALARASALSLLLQANVVIHYYLFAKALNFSVPVYVFFLIIPLAIFVMMIPVSINGIGVRETAFVFFFAPFDVSKSEAIALAWLAYGVVIFQGVLGGIVYTLRR